MKLMYCCSTSSHMEAPFLMLMKSWFHKQILKPLEILHIVFSLHQTQHWRRTRCPLNKSENSSLTEIEIGEVCYVRFILTALS